MLLELNHGNLHETQQVLGHSRQSMTADLYGHLQPEVMERREAQVDDYYAKRGLRRPA